MTALGVQLTLWMGPAVPIPPTPDVMEALDTVEIHQNDDGRSGFQITFRVGRSGVTDLIDYSLLLNPMLKPFSRVFVMVTYNAFPHILMDGIITQQQLAPSNEPGATTLTLTGEDVSVMMDLEEKSAEHPAQDETIIAMKIIATYAMYGMIPTVIPPVVIDPPIPIERTPVQQGTDLSYLREMAARHGYVFYVTPGPAPLTNTAYWGPPNRLDIPQPALSVGMGPDSNVQNLQFVNDGLASTLVSGQVQDRLTNVTIPVQTFASTRVPMVSQPSWFVNMLNNRTKILRDGGLNIAQAFGRAQAMTDKSTDSTITVKGELDSVQYGGVLKARGIVGMRGVGYSYDGNYYVKNVTHVIKKGEYKQKFTLTREGVGALLPVVVP